jgi:hypothetical protein
MRDYANEANLSETVSVEPSDAAGSSDRIQPVAAFAVSALANVFSMKIVDLAARATQIALTVFVGLFLIVAVWALAL